MWLSIREEARPKRDAVGIIVLSGLALLALASFLLFGVRAVYAIWGGLDPGAGITDAFVAVGFAIVLVPVCSWLIGEVFYPSNGGWGGWDLW